MRVGFRVILHSLWGAAVGISLAEDGIDGTAHDFRVTGLDVFLGLSGGSFW